MVLHQVVLREHHLCDCQGRNSSAAFRACTHELMLTESFAAAQLAGIDSSVVDAKRLSSWPPLVQPWFAPLECPQLLPPRVPPEMPMPPALRDQMSTVSQNPSMSDLLWAHVSRSHPVAPDFHGQGVQQSCPGEKAGLTRPIRLGA